MSFPTVFANLPGSPSTNPASLIDTMFQIVGGMGAIPCTATGTNAITLTPVTNYYLPAAYANFQAVAFVAANSASGAVTIQLGALGFVNLYMPSGLQANSGDINANVLYFALYNGALNSGGGGFQVFNASTPSVVQPVVGGFKNLKITNGGTPDTQVVVIADQVMLGSVAAGSAKVSGVNVTISTGTSGANGLDAGSIAQATWYSIWVIFNGSTTAGLISLSSTAPTLPSGYIYRARVGWIQTGAASTNLTRIIQYGRDVQWVVTAASQTPNLPIISSVQTEGSLSVPTWIAKALATFVPPTASRIRGIVGIAGNNVVGAIVAPNNSYGATNSATNPPPCSINNLNAATLSSVPFDFALESTNIYTANNATSGFLLQAIGWQDNI